MKIHGFGMALSVLLAPLSAPAQDLVPRACRPLFTTSAAPADPGVLELEFGAQRIANRDGSTDTLAPIQFNLGLTPWLDFRVGWGGPLLRKDSKGEEVRGGTDPVLGAQVLFLRQASAGLDLGMAWWHKHPRASIAKGISTGRHDDTFLLTFSRVQGRFLVDVNAGANFLGRPGAEGRVRQGVVSLAITCAVAPGWNLTLDTYAVERTELNPRATSSILAVSRDFSSRLCVDLGVEVGHGAGAPDHSINAGLVYRFGPFWTRR